jgi:F0F1-type ATP synthase membrane subunit b/b'
MAAVDVSAGRMLESKTFWPTRRSIRGYEAGLDGRMCMVELALAESSIQLIPDGTLALHVLVVLVMVGVLNLTLYGPLNRILDERDRETKGREVRAVLASVEMKLSQCERRLRESRVIGYQLVEQERASALSERESKLRALKGKMREWTIEEKVLIEQQTEDVRRELRRELKGVGVQISAQILCRPINGSKPTD